MAIQLFHLWLKITRQSRSGRTGSLLPISCLRGAVLNRRVHCRTEYPLFLLVLEATNFCQQCTHIHRRSCNNIVVMCIHYFSGIRCYLIIIIYVCFSDPSLFFVGNHQYLFQVWRQSKVAIGDNPSQNIYNTPACEEGSWSDC